MTVRVGDPELVLDPYDYDFHEDPYPYYRRLRDEAPLYRNEERNFWAVSRHHDVLQGFRDSTALSNAYGVSLDPSSRTSEAYRVMSMLAMDDPAHLRMRTLVSKGFTPRRIRELEPQVLELARIHLDSALQTESFDFVAEFAGKLPMDVISELIGVPDTDRARIRALADAVLHREDGVADVPPPAMAASIELMRYYADLIAEFRRRPANNLTSALLAAELDGDRLSDQEIMAFLFLMVIAGNETTTKLLANAVYWAAHHPGQLARVFADHSRIPMWVEETLRYDTSSQILARTVAHDLTLYDTTIPEGEVLLLLPGSANRDDRVFDDPDDYRIGREIGCKLVSFGSGAHFCLGAHLARMEARVALGALLRRIRNYEVDDDNVVRVHSSNVRGFAHLPISATTGSGTSGSVNTSAALASTAAARVVSKPGSPGPEPTKTMRPGLGLRPRVMIVTPSHFFMRANAALPTSAPGRPARTAPRRPRAPAPVPDRNCRCRTRGSRRIRPAPPRTRAATAPRRHGRPHRWTRPLLRSLPPVRSNLPPGRQAGLARR